MAAEHSTQIPAREPNTPTVMRRRNSTSRPRTANKTPQSGSHNAGNGNDNDNDLDDDDEATRQEPTLKKANGISNDIRRLENIDDYHPQLMSYMDNSDNLDTNAEDDSGGDSFAIASSSEEESPELDDLDDDEFDDSSIEAEEERAIRSELNLKKPIPGPVSLRRLSQSHGRAVDTSDSSSSESPPQEWDASGFFDDYFDMPLDANNEDDSYLWQYFFSSDDEAAAVNPLLRSKQRRNKREAVEDSFFTEGPAQTGETASTDDDIPLKGRGPLPGEELAKYVPTGDSTDEDDVPPERKRKRARGTKAIEVLGSDSFSAQPPVLGSWRIRGDKNVGIIDGLTTRTLSPPPPPQKPAPPQPQEHRKRGGTPQDPFEGLNDHDLADFSEKNQANANEDEVSDLDLLELGDFLNTDNLSSDDNQVYEFDLMLDNDQHQQDEVKTPLVSPYLYRNRMSKRNTPVPAFRNRDASAYVASPYAGNLAYPADTHSPLQRRRRSSVNRRMASINKKRPKKRPSRHENDFIGELVEIGAMSPIHEGYD